MPALIHQAGLVNMIITFWLFPVLKVIAITKANSTDAETTSLNKSKLKEFENFEYSCRNSLLKRIQSLSLPVILPSTK